MDKEGKLDEVSLPRASESDSIFKEKLVVAEKLVNEDKTETIKKQASESDNEEVPEQRNDVNLDDEFEKIVPDKNLAHEQKEEEQEEEEVKKTTEIASLNPGDSEILKSASEDSAEKINEVEIVETEKKNCEIVQKIDDVNINDFETNVVSGELTDKEEDLTEKPPVPIQTYLWEDVKRSKEQGGYPWTHLYKTPLNPGEEPEIILNYKYSPRSRRRGESVDSLGTPKSQKKVRIQEKVEVHEVENSPTNDENDEENLEKHHNLEEATGGKEEKVVQEEEIKPETNKDIPENLASNNSKSDSGSLKRKIKNPLEKIKRLADNHFKKVKSSIPKMPFKKGEIALNEELTIRKLKESPKAERREITSYVFKHQDSDDTIDIVELEESPMESRRRKENNLVTPDEIIDLPSKDEETTSQQQQEADESEEASTIDTNDLTLSESSKEEVSPPKKQSHGRQYEEIEDYISKITSDIEHVERNPTKELKRQNDIMSNEAMFDEFSMVMNKNIRKSLSEQDERIRQELAKRIPKIEDLEKQISDEDKNEEIIQQKQQTHLLAPISSIDSTSSDEHSKAQLSILAEESENSDSKRKSFETEASVDNEIESLKNDGSDVSTTLIEDELISYTIKSSEVEENVVEKIDDIVVVEEEKVKEILDDGEKEKKLQTENEPKQQENLENSVKEDIVVDESSLLSAEPAKIISRWSKIGKLFRKKSKLRKVINQCIPLKW